MARSSAYRWRNWRIDTRSGQSIKSWKRKQVEAAKRKPQPASEKQLAYIASLARQLGIPTPKSIATKDGASNVIRDLKKRCEKQAGKRGATG